MTIYEINKEINDVFEKAKEMSTGDDDIQNDVYLQELKDNFKTLEIKRNEKISNIIKYYKNKKYLLESIKNEILNLEKRAKLLSNEIGSYENFINYVLEGESFEDSISKVSYRKSEIVDILVSIDDIPEEFKRIKISIEPDKTEIKKYIKNNNVTWAKIIEKRNIQIK